MRWLARLNLAINSATLADIRPFVQQHADLLLGKFAQDPSLPRQVSVDFIAEHICKSVDLRIEHFETSKLKGLICLTNSAWDSKHFGMQIGKMSHTIFDSELETDERLQMFKKLKTESRNRGLDMIFGRLPFSDIKGVQDRKSTRLNSSHRCISYAVFCLKKKKKKKTINNIVKI